MPATHPTALSLVPPSRANSGLIFNIARQRGDRRKDGPVTARRSPGVGTPTTGSAIAPDRGDQTVLIVIDTCEAALTAISSLETQARDVAKRFRVSPGVEAQQGLAHLVESTQTLLRLASMTAAVANTDLEQLCARCGQAGMRLHTAVASAIRAQLVTDWDALATTLEAELTSALASWRRVFAAIVAPFDSGPSGHAA
jgi:hypothetical protein